MKITLLVVLTIVLIILTSSLLLWALNTLFNLGIQYNIETILAASVILLAISSCNTTFQK